MPTFLTVAGLLDGDRLELQPGFQVELETGAPELPPADAPAAPAVTLEFAAASGRVLASSRLAVEAMCLHDVAASGWLISGLVQWQDGATMLRVTAGDRLLVTREIGTVAPKPLLTWSPDAIADGIQTVTWSIRDAPTGPLAHMVTYSWDGLRWLPLCLPATDTVLTVDFDDLPGGEACQLRIHSTDGVRTGTVDSAPFAVRRKGVTPVIIAPESDAVLPSTVPVWLHGQLYDWEGRAFADAEELRWTSSRQGDLGAGELVEARLRPGDHRLTLSAPGVDAVDSALVFVDGDLRPA